MILVINPGSTSTKLAVFEERRQVADEEIQHAKGDLASFERVADQFEYRMQAIFDFLEKAGVDEGQLTAVVGRGGLLHPLSGGVYEVSDDMADDLQKARYGEHPCNLGGLLARELANQRGVPSYVVDPVVTDEMMDKARLTGIPAIERRSLFHALNQRGVARMVSERLDIAYENSNFIVCHMGGGISIGAHRHGRVVDVSNGLDGEGPFTPERTGSLPVIPVLDLIESGAMSLAAIRQVVLRQGGIYAHLGTNDPRDVVARMETGDKDAALVFDGLAYNIAKNISAMIPALVDENGKLSLAAIIVTGGVARSAPLVAEISRLVGHFAAVEVVPGELEMASLASGAQRALCGREPVRQYMSEEA